MKKPKIAIYVQQKYAKPTYKTESYNVRIWPGVEMVRDDLQRRGYEVGYCDIGTVTDYDIVMVSITSACDWYPFIAERVKWPKGDYKVLMGGAGFMNARPFLEYFDAGVFGRAEGLTHHVIDSLMTGNELDEPSVCYPRSFSVDKRYEVRQATECYPHLYALPRGENWREQSIGCRRKCLFCQYTWTRRFLADLDGISGVYNTQRVSERTIFDFDLETPQDWTADACSYVIVGVDGFSERLRFMANKPITDDLLTNFIVASVRCPNIYLVKLFNIVGYPTESMADWHRLVEVFQAADIAITKTSDARSLYIFEVTNNHFKTDPLTPYAVVPGRAENLRWKPADTVRVGRLEKRSWRHKVFTGQHLRVLFMHSTESLPTVALNQLALRGIEKDAKVARSLATNRRFWNADTKTRQVTVEKYLDIGRLFGVYRWDTLPTRYLHTYVPYEKMARLTDRNLRKYGGAEGQRIADQIAGKIPGAY